MFRVPEAQVLEDFFDDRRVIYEADDLHLCAALGAFQRIDFPDFLDALTLGF
jgi:hypothetical protein